MDIVDVFFDDDDAVVIDHGDFLVFEYDFHIVLLISLVRVGRTYYSFRLMLCRYSVCASVAGASVVFFSPRESGRQAYHKSMGVFIVWHAGRSLKGQYSSLPTDISFIRLIDFIQSMNER